MTSTNIIASVRIVPIGTATASIRNPVEDSISALKKSGLTCKINPTCTELCGSWEEIHNAIKAAVDSVLDKHDINRLMCDVHLDVKKFSRTVTPEYVESP